MAFTATLSQSQGRASWSVIFHHPGKPDQITGKPRRVRRGLGTENRDEAGKTVSDLNQLLSDSAWWTPAARGRAGERFSKLAVTIFYDAMEGPDNNPLAIRERLLPLTATEGRRARRVTLIGPTGAGKTTVLRQLIGTTPDERFPATSKAKTTIHDTEIVVRPGLYAAAVTFISRDEVTEHLAENLVRAIADAAEGRPDSVLTRAILVHTDERMRFNYVLGNGPVVDDEDDEEDSPQIEMDGAHPPVGLLADSEAAIAASLSLVRAIAAAQQPLAVTFAASESSADQQQQLYEEELERLSRSDERFHEAIDLLTDQIEKRFELLTLGQLERDTTSWPRAWQFASNDRSEFLREVRRFASNHAALFGALLTPLVNGVRVAGPFHPSWISTPAPIVFFDGQGLGHNPNTAASLPTSLIDRMSQSDVVLLVDNAEMPMQAAPAAAVREIFATGLMSRLVIAFTHMDQLRADNLRNQSDRREHVLGSARGVAGSLREFNGSSGGALAERAFRKVLDERTAFISFADMDLTIERTGARKAKEAMEQLYQMISSEPDAIESGPSAPRYSSMTLSLAAHRAVSKFLSEWGGRLGVAASSTPRAKWQTIKAMNLRLASWQGLEGYRDLEPVSDFRRDLMSQMSGWVHSPLGWTGTEPSDDEKSAIFDRFAQSLTGRVTELARLRVKSKPLPEWVKGMELSGTGSTFLRARMIFQEILQRAAPPVDVAVSVDANQLLDELSAIVKAAAVEAGVELVGGTT